MRFDACPGCLSVGSKSEARRIRRRGKPVSVTERIHTFCICKKPGFLHLKTVVELISDFLPSSNSPWSEGGEQNYSEIFTPTFIGDNLGQINTDF